MAFVKRNKFKAVTLIMDRRAYNPGLAVVRVGHRGREQNRYCIGKWVVGVPRVFRRHKTDVVRDSGSERTGAGHSANARTLSDGRTTCALSFVLLSCQFYFSKATTVVDSFKSISNRLGRNSGNLA